MRISEPSNEAKDVRYDNRCGGISLPLDACEELIGEAILEGLVSTSTAATGALGE